MPFTAKFSERFYEQLGHDVVNELVDWVNTVDLTYRTELREQNEINFQRFDARLDQRFAEADARLEVRFGVMEQRFAEIEQRFAKQEARFEARFGALDTRIESVRADLLKWMIGFWATTILTMIGTGVVVVSLLR